MRNMSYKNTTYEAFAFSVVQYEYSTQQYERQGGVYEIYD